MDARRYNFELTDMSTRQPHGSVESLGRRIRRCRLEAGRTQRDVSRSTGLAISYLSRLENDRVQPSVRTLQRVAEALGAPMAWFFEPEGMLEERDRCPVSLDGRCILEHLFTGARSRRKIDVEAYSALELETLRLCNRLLHSKDEAVRNALHTLVRALARQSTKPAGRP